MVQGSPQTVGVTDAGGITVSDFDPPDVAPRSRRPPRRGEPPVVNPSSGTSGDSVRVTLPSAVTPVAA